METDFWNNFWMVVVGLLSLATSIVAIYLAYNANRQVEKQIVLSNKQLLFEKRIDVYAVVKRMNIFCSITLERKKELTSEDVPILLGDLSIDDFFEEIDSIASIEVGNESLEDIQVKIKYNEGLKKILVLTDTLLLIFDDDKDLNNVSRFILAYHDVLSEIYEYYNAKKSLIALNEVQYHMHKLKNRFDNMEDSHSLEHLKKSIKLF